MTEAPQMDGAESRPSTITLSGEIDIATIDPITSAVENQINTGVRHIIFDLCEVTFLDSTALALFAQTARRIDRVTLAHPNDMIRRMIELTGLGAVLDVEP
jgi:anti-sigma B factor antagonist